MSKKRNKLIKVLFVSSALSLMLPLSSFAQSSTETEVNSRSLEFPPVDMDKWFAGTDKTSVVEAIDYLESEEALLQPDVYKSALNHALRRLLQIRKSYSFKFLSFGQKSDLRMPFKMSSVLNSFLSFLNDQEASKDKSFNLQALSLFTELMAFSSFTDAEINRFPIGLEPMHLFHKVIKKIAENDKEKAYEATLRVLDKRGLVFLADLNLVDFMLQADVDTEKQMLRRVDDFLFKLSNASRVTEAEMRFVSRLGKMPKMVKLRGYVLLDIAKKYFIAFDEADYPTFRKYKTYAGTDFIGHGYETEEVSAPGVRALVQMLTQDLWSHSKDQLSKDAQDFLFNRVLNNAGSGAEHQARKYFGIEFFKTVSKASIDANVPLYDGMLLTYYNGYRGENYYNSREFDLLLDSKIYNLPSYKKLSLRVLRGLLYDVAGYKPKNYRSSIIELFNQDPIANSVDNILFLLNEIRVAIVNADQPYDDASLYKSLAHRILSEPKIKGHSGWKNILKPGEELKIENLVKAGAFKAFEDAGRFTEILPGIKKAMQNSCKRLL